YCTISYIKDDTGNGDYYPATIVYTKSSTQTTATAYNTVTFSYEARSDSEVMYEPTFVSMARRLKWITVTTGTDSSQSMVRKYRLDYESSPLLSKSRLIAVQQYGSDGNAPPQVVDASFTATGTTLPAETFVWQNGSIAQATIQSSSIAGNRPG